MTTDSILRNATGEELGLAVEENVYAMFRSMTQVLNGEIEETDQLSRFHAWPSSPSSRVHFGLGLNQTRLMLLFLTPLTGTKRVMLHSSFGGLDGNDTQPKNLGEKLEAHGLAVFEKDAPSMVADINNLNWDNPRPSELRLNPISNNDELAQWKQTFIEAFGVPEFAGQAWVEATQAVGIGKTPWHLLLGTLNSEAVCCGLLYCGAGVAGLLGLGTLPAFRRKGIGSAMQLERLRIARELGYQYAVLFASEMGYSPYIKLGFKDTGRRVSRYLWRNQ